MDDSTLLTQLQAQLRTLTPTFSTTDVVINDWSILDGPSSNAPYALIETPDEIEILEIESDAQYTLVAIPLYLIVRFLDWTTSKNDFLSLRTTVLNHLSSPGDFAKNQGQLGAIIRKIRSGSDVIGIYDRYEENERESLPVFLTQQLLIDVLYYN